MSTSLIPLFLLSLTASVNAGGWEFYAWGGLPGMIGYGRLDPILSPGVVSVHVHQINGANAMQASYDYDTLREQSTCSSVVVQDDLSNYWSPAMYHYDGASNYSLMLARFNVYYHTDTFSYSSTNTSGSNTRVAFPEGLVMLGGDMYKRNATDSHAVFQCLRASGNSPYSNDMRDFQIAGLNCDQSLRATVDMPSCWDGVADNSDLTHVVYPSWGVCPASHPQALMHITQEYYWPVQAYPFDASRTDNWVLSFGDTSGFGMHADFANGWNTTLLTEAINDPTCNSNEGGIEKCKAFSQWNNTQIPPCMPSGDYPNEPVGLNGVSLTSLPGCNALWTDNSTKPTCASTSTPPIDLKHGPDLSGYNYVSCPFGFTSTGPMMTNFTLVNVESLDVCLDVCSNYTWIGVTQQPDGDLGWVTECWCDNELRNDWTLRSNSVYACQQRCPDNYLELCGGYGSWQVYEKCSGDACHQNSAFPSSPATASSAPASTSTALATSMPASSSTVIASSTPATTSTATATSAAASSSSISTSTSEAVATTTSNFPTSSQITMTTLYPPSNTPQTSSSPTSLQVSSETSSSDGILTTMTTTRTNTHHSTTRTVTRTRTFLA